MNKAFVREPDDTGQRNCPRCRALGLPVGHEAVATHLKPNAQRAVGEGAFFCPTPTCEVAYFDLFDRMASTDDLTGRVFPKDPSAPVSPASGSRSTRSKSRSAAVT